MKQPKNSPLSQSSAKNDYDLPGCRSILQRQAGAASGNITAPAAAVVGGVVGGGSSSNNEPSGSADATRWKSSQQVRSPLLQRQTVLEMSSGKTNIVNKSPVKQRSMERITSSSATPPPVSRPQDLQMNAATTAASGGEQRGWKKKKRRTVLVENGNVAGSTTNDDDDLFGRIDAHRQPRATSVDHTVFREQEGCEDATSTAQSSSSNNNIPLQQQRRAPASAAAGAAAAAASFFSPACGSRSSPLPSSSISTGTPLQRQRRAEVTAAVRTATFMQSSTVRNNSDAAAVLAREREQSRRAEAFQWGADAPREWTEQMEQHGGGGGDGGAEHHSPSGRHHLPPFVPERVKQTFFWLKREVAGADREEAATAALQALEQLADTTPVIKPVIDIALGHIIADRAFLRQQVDASRGKRDDTAGLRAQLEQASSQHYAELLGERSRTKQASSEAALIREKFSKVEEEWQVKVIDAHAEVRSLSSDLRERTEEVAELREALGAVMSVRKAQKQHVEEVQAKAEKTMADAAREVAIIHEELAEKKDTILKLETQMQGERRLAAKELADYKSIALPPAKSGALRGEADRYKKECAKLKEKVEKLQAELLKREAYEPAVAWEEILQPADLQQLCTICGIPANTSTAALLEADELDEEEEMELNKLINRSKDFSVKLYDMWRSVLDSLKRYQQEREVFDGMAQVLLDVGLPMDLLQMHGEPLIVQALEKAHHRTGDTRLLLDSPPIDSASPEPWLDPMYTGCFLNPPAPGTLPTELDAPILAQAEYRFAIHKVLIPPCLMSLASVRGLLVSALVLLGLNRVRDLDRDWHPARQFSFAIRAQLEAALHDIKALASDRGAALAAEHLAAQQAATGDAATAAHDAAHARRRRFALPPLSEIDDKSSIAACMTVLYHRLAQYADSDAFIGFCLSLFLGRRPALPHARYFAVCLRGAGQFFNRVEKMWRPSSCAGALPKPLLLNSLRSAFNVCSSSATAASDVQRLAVATFHTHYWTQIRSIQHSQLPANPPATERERLEASEAEMERSKMSKAQLAADVEQYNQGLLHTLTSWQDASEISYRTIFGTLRAGDASPLLLQVAHLYALDVSRGEAAVHSGMLSFSKTMLVSRWNSNDVVNAAEYWIMNSGSNIAGAPGVVKDSARGGIAPSPAGTGAAADGGANNNNNASASGEFSGEMSLAAAGSFNHASLTAHDGSGAQAAPASGGPTLAAQLSRWHASLGRNFNFEQEEQGVEVIDDSQAAAAAAATVSNLASSLRNPDAIAGAEAASIAKVSAAQICLQRIQSFLAAGVFDPSDCLQFESILSHLPTRPVIGFEDNLAHSPMEAPEPKQPTAANAGPAPPVALASLSATKMSEDGHTAPTPELLRNLTQSLVHTRLLAQVAAGSFFLVDPFPSGDTLAVAGCVELANEQAAALSRAAAAPETKAKKKPGRK